MALPNLRRGGNVKREMHMLPVARMESRSTNRRHKPRRSPMVEHLGLCCGWQGKVNDNRMPLIRPNTLSIVTEREPLLVILSHNLLQQWAREPVPPAVGETDEFLNVGPSVLVQGQADLLWFMAQDKAEELADLYDISHHPSSVFSSEAPNSILV